MNQIGRQALTLYRDASIGTRLHVRVRWHTCPFPPVAAVLPEVGRILEIGCGHGLLSAYAALQSPRRVVRGIDVDAAKIAAAQQAAARAREQGADLDFAVAEAPPDGPWDGIAIVDVLYLLDAAAQHALLQRCAAALAPGGTLAIKEMGLHPRWKARWNVLQESLSVRVLGITHGHAFTFLPPAELEATLGAAGLRTSSARLDAHRPHPHHLVVARRSA